MKISRNRFEEILSAYLDAEATPEELELLAKCVREDETMASLYYKSCRVHYMTCKMFGKKANFIKLKGVVLPEFEPKKISKFRATFEWSVVACLMVLSVSLLGLAIISLSLEDNKVAKKTGTFNVAQVKTFKTEVNAHSVVEDGAVFSVIKVRAISPIFLDDKD